ncbi:YqcI/YcgG family protein [Streptomyces sp. CA-111067]|uniref:YqcI/YcgG family protein n=1 Tax=Streptomyces sp. CA-111067 TaxID=3240046 RepID=UPI003D956146
MSSADAAGESEPSPAAPPAACPKDRADLTHAADDDIRRQTIGSLPRWGADRARELLGTLTAADDPFPCTFAVAAAKRTTLRFGFVDDLDNEAAWKLLPGILSGYLGQYQGISRETSLVVFFRDDGPPRGLDAYHERFWSILQYLHDEDQSPWPEQTPTDPEHFLWEFCFEGTEIFVVCNTPAHDARRSRHSPVFVITFQPRWVFEGLEQDTPRGSAARRTIRTRLRRFDAAEPAAELGSYGDPDNREWRQYFLPDGDGEPMTGCPFHARRPSRSPNRP